jgi:hypothetical protein
LTMGVDCSAIRAGATGGMVSLARRSGSQEGGADAGSSNASILTSNLQKVGWGR